MKYLKVFTDFADITDQLSDAELGRLFRAMMKYTSTGQEPSFSGNERFLWATAKRNIDLQTESYEKKIESMANARKLSPNNRSLTENCSKLNSKEQITVEEQEQDKEQDKDKEQDNKHTSRFIPPTIEEVKAYCQERQNGIDPESFVDFYASKGWKIGKEPMKDWKAAIRTWERRKQDAGSNKQQGSSERDRKSEEVRRRYAGRDFYSE